MTIQMNVRTDEI